jgi:hypothetical protein
MEMQDILVYLATALGILASLVVLVDSVPRMRAAWRRRRLSRGGAFGAVLDPAGRVLGVYLDPFGHRWRAARVHEYGSAWVSDPEGWACEGFGETAEEALESAHRLRRRHRQLLGLREDDGDGDLPLVTPPWAPPSQ